MSQVESGSAKLSQFSTIHRLHTNPRSAHALPAPVMGIRNFEPVMIRKTEAGEPPALRQIVSQRSRDATSH